ncbi:MAG: phosphohydrolase [Draconibacterium sp.]|nr:MAG: phosphohydrolase [Draconibacterium sp.]
MASVNKKKIVNDPVLGFITIQSEVIFDLIEKPVFQRLRNIKQLGLSYLVYPGANHTRFEHALGTIHLMRQAIAVLRLKGVEITDEEADAVTIAILLHDIGHAPFSHVLENTLVDISHEKISLLLMREINKELGGKLDMAISIFTNQYKKRFLHQLVSSQLDMDRLDYLNRDSFFTGVAEGTIGVERIIKMLNVWKDELVVDVKGIYSIEKFLISRRLMYWQVYLHKTVVSAESLLINVLKRARDLVAENKKIFVTPALQIFLENNFSPIDFEKNIEIQQKNILYWYTQLDDNDIFISVKEWINDTDPVLSYLAQSLHYRKLFKTEIRSTALQAIPKNKILEKITKRISNDEQLSHYYLMTGKLTNNAYSKSNEKIRVLQKSGRTKDIQQASDINLLALTKTVHKFFVCYPKELDIYKL